MGERPTHMLTLPLVETRDSDALERSNMRVALRMLGGESATVRVMRSSHWLCGWIEVILIDPNDGARVECGERIADILDREPMLDETDYADLAHEMGEDQENVA